MATHLHAGTDDVGETVDTVDGEIHRRFVATSAGGGPDSPARRVLLRRLVREMSPLAADAAVEATVDRVEARIVGLGPLAPLLDDPTISDILVNGDGAVWVERHGTLAATGMVLADHEVEHLIERIVGPLGRRADRTSPVVDARLPDGSRVHAVVAPVAVDGPCLAIRRFAVRPVELAEFGAPAVVRYLVTAVQRRANIVVSGGTGAGKTTLLNALAAHIAPGERVITIEDAAELRLAGDHVVRLETHAATGLDTRALVRNALRMRPDRIVVGECRGPEALDMLQAMNTGHPGSMSTVHANGPLDALRRLQTMVLAGHGSLPPVVVRDLLARAIDVVVHLRRGSGRGRAVDQVIRRCAADNTVRPVGDDDLAAGWTR